MKTYIILKPGDVRQEGDEVRLTTTGPATRTGKYECTGSNPKGAPGPWQPVTFFRELIPADFCLYEFRRPV